MSIQSNLNQMISSIGTMVEAKEKGIKIQEDTQQELDNAANAPDLQAAAEETALGSLVTKSNVQTEQAEAMDRRLNILKLKEAANQMRESGIITSNTQLKKIIHRINQEEEE